jgi:hydroxymethylglutaryl-CoA reductase
MVLSASGLAQNLAAIRALASEGIQRGHMKLHARNIAAIAGAEGDLIYIVANRIVKENNINVNRAKEILKSLSSKTK